MTAGAARAALAEMTNPADLVQLVASAMAPPNTATVTDLLVNRRLEDTR